MYFGDAAAAIREPHIGNPFELSPPHAAVQLAEASADADRTAEGDGLNVANLANDLEGHLCEPAGLRLIDRAAPRVAQARAPSIAPTARQLLGHGPIRSRDQKMAERKNRACCPQDLGSRRSPVHR